jgi:hypothetical protein
VAYEGNAARFEGGEIFEGGGDDGVRKTLPAEARRAFWFQGLTVPGVVRMPVAPKASAERMRVPRLPGSCRPAAIEDQGVLVMTASSLWTRRDEQRRDALREIGFLRRWRRCRLPAK